MKIAHVVEAWKGGIASYVDALIAAQVNDGHDVILIADSTLLAMDERRPGGRLAFYKSTRNPVRVFSTSLNIEAILQPERPDLVIFHSTFPGVYGRLRASSRYRSVFIPHGWSFFKRDVSRVVRKIYRLLETFLARNCSSIVCMSLEEANSALELGIDPNRVLYIPTGIKNLPIIPANETRSNSLKVGFFGRYDYQKGFDILAHAAKYMPPGIELHTFGGAVRGSRLKSNSNLLDHGWISHGELHQVIAQMDIVIIPSRWEGFALTPLEAMRAGRAVIVSNTTSLSETVIHGFNGLVMAQLSTEQIVSTLSALDRDECRRMGENARKVFDATYTFDRFYERFVNLVHQGA